MNVSIAFILISVAVTCMIVFICDGIEDFMDNFAGAMFMIGMPLAFALAMLMPLFNCVETPPSAQLSLDQQYEQAVKAND